MAHIVQAHGMEAAEYTGADHQDLHPHSSYSTTSSTTIREVTGAHHCRPWQDPPRDGCGAGPAVRSCRRRTQLSLSMAAAARPVRAPMPMTRAETP
ncbi:hypothetical protein GCM10027030_07080 [Luteococcus sediminum]